MKLSRAISLFVIFLAVSSCASEPSPWAFEYPGDEFSASAMLDLRYLNEDYAGAHGFIGLTEDGESFQREDGEPIRFWPVNGGSATRNMNDEELAWHARFLAKQGVNMNRWHGSVNPPGKGTGIFELDTAEVDFIWRFVAAMKREGIYSTISPFWAHNGHMGGWIPEAWGIDGYSGKDDLWEVMYFNDHLKEAYKQWVKYLYTEENPYTGVPLKDEPAVALIQIKNEDGVFFWTMQGIKPELERLVGKLFADWSTDKYGSLAAAYQAWEGEKLQKDDPVAGVLGIYPTWEMLQEEAQYVRGEDTLQGYTILDTGKMPWMAQPTRVELTVRNRNVNKAILLDLAGYPVRELDVKRRGDALLVDLPPESLYVILMNKEH
jgi:hypothetical protein